MGLRFRKSISVAKGVKVNINKKSAGVTVGKRGAHYTINTTGKQTASVGLPGTGLSYSKSFGGKKKSSKASSSKKSSSSSSTKSAGDDLLNEAKAAGNNSGCIILAIAAVAIVAILVFGIWGIVKLIVSHKDKASSTDKGSVESVVNNDSSSNSTGDKSSSDSSSSTSGEMVWVTSSGSKYHSKSDCGGISGATQISLEEAESRGLTPCKKCH
ncbi:MAG: DUF4236 domain-containing protein [Lachnospiraceae bacterium]|nr:DUF4236 domain-containing protein [Lachnospiraceae bacterium]MBQ9233292.1 DUF4236 domain-containing protein [Lachnospiraceae bacterium]